MRRLEQTFEDDLKTINNLEKEKESRSYTNQINLLLQDVKKTPCHNFIEYVEKLFQRYLEEEKFLQKIAELKEYIEYLEFNNKRVEKEIRKEKDSNEGLQNTINILNVCIEKNLEEIAILELKNIIPSDMVLCLIAFLIYEKKILQILFYLPGMN